MSATQTSSSNLLATLDSTLRDKRRSRRFSKSISSDSGLSMPVPALAPPPACSEWPAIQSAITGDSEPLAQLFAVYGARLHRTAFAVLRNKADAEDAVQDGLCRAYIKLTSFQGRSSFSTWLTRIIINSALMIRRKRDRRPETSLDAILENKLERTDHQLVHTGRNPEQLYGAAEMQTLFERQVRELPPGIRVAYQLREVDGLSSECSQQILGIHNGAFKSRISRARLKIARGLRRSLQTPTNRGCVGEASLDAELSEAH